MNNNYNTPNLHDFGAKPLVFNISKYTRYNENYRTALWTGNNLQLTLMSIPVMGDIGVERHDDIDQFIRIEDGNALVQMGNEKNRLYYQKRVNGGFAVIIPKGIWHNIVNIGNTELKLYSIYAPSEHPYGTIDKTKEDAIKREEDTH